jgi:F-type H+-transporting ATPase subunit a
VFIITSVKATGHYWMHIINPPGIPLWLLPIMIPVEIVGVISKPFVLMLRLFANVTAGHIIILAFTSLIFIFYGKFGAGGAVGASVVSVAFSIFMNLLELLVAFLQAYVFTLLAALYFGGAIEEAHHAHEEAHH